MRSAWTGPPALLPSLALKVLLNASRKVNSLRIKVKSHKEVGHLNKVWSVILQGTLVSHLKLVILKDLGQLSLNISERIFGGLLAKKYI